MVKELEGMGGTPNRRAPFRRGALHYQHRRNGMSKNSSKNMESFIANAVENKTEEESRLIFDNDDMFGTPRIVIVGCGGAGVIQSQD